MKSENVKQNKETEQKKTIKLRTQPKYQIVINYVIILLDFLLAPIPILSYPWYNVGILIVNIILCLIIIGGIVYGLARGALYLQFAKVDDEKIIIKDIFHVIAVVKWSEITSVKREYIITDLELKESLLEWIVIRTDENQKCNKAKINKKGRYPILIIANEKNILVFGTSLQKHK